MAKKPTITSITSGYASTNTLNDNFEALRDAFDNTLSLDGSTPNSMTSDLNLNNNDILNASRILVGGVDYIATALSYKNAAEAAQTAAETAQAAAELVYDNFDDRYLGSKASDPTLDNDGDALLDGALYYDTINTVMKFYDTSTSTWYRTTPTTSDQANIDIVAGNTTNINTVAGISSDVTTVAGISSDVTTVAADGTDIGTVATSISNVNTTATNISNINTVAGISANVTTVAGNTSNINTVATDISNVNTVAGQTTNLQNVTDNLTAIQNAATNAANAATSASNAATSASNASTSETNAASSATAAAASAAAAASSADFFDDVYLGSKASDPSVDNDGDALNAGDLYFNTTSNTMRVYSGSAWQDAAVDSSGFVQTTGDTMTGDLSFGDNNKAIFGAGSDLQIYHDTSASYISDQGAGPLNVLGSQVNMYNAAEDTQFASWNSSSAKTYIGGSLITNTTSTGVDITGTLTSDGLTVDGNGAFSNASPRIQFEETDTTDQDVWLRLNSGTFTIETRTDAGVKSGDRIRAASNGDISFYEDTGTTAKFFWDASAERLGIGTTSPDTLLDLSSSTNTYQTIQSTSGSNNALTYYKNASVAVDGVSIGLNALEEMMLWQSENNVMRFGTNNTERMRIDSSGNVGIGTTSPNAKLEVANDGAGEADVARFKRSNGADLGFLDISINPDANEAIFDASGSTSQSYVFRSGGTERMRIGSSGRVGIGTSSPDTLLHVYQSADSNGLTIGGFRSTNQIKLHLTGSANEGFVIQGDRNSGSFESIYNASDVVHQFHIQGSEAMRIDSSGNLLVGKTSADGITTAGHQFNSTGYTSHVRNNGVVSQFNRQTSDGDIVQFFKDGTTVGSIIATSGDLGIGTTDTGVRFNNSIDSVFPINVTTGFTRDASIDLGYSSSRFKDLYLSGGVYLGGTGAANKLDDVETGTWTPSLAGSTTNPSLTYNTAAGAYEKIGAFVHASFFMNVGAVSSQGSGQLRISGLPFTTTGTVASAEVPAVLLQTEPFNDGDGSGRQQYARTQTNSTQLLMGYKDGNGGATVPSNAAANVGTGYLIGHIVYKTNS